VFKKLNINHERHEEHEENYVIYFVYFKLLRDLRTPQGGIENNVLRGLKSFSSKV